MKQLNHNEVREAVRRHYGDVAQGCCGGVAPEDTEESVFRSCSCLKPGGRIAVSDIVLTTILPEELQNDLFLYTGCMAGASSLQDIEAYLVEVGYGNILITPKDKSRDFILEWVPGRKLEDFVVSADIEAIKPVA